ncbi:MAG: GatB/YqeY domain-containing protein [Akkermansia sp.]|nr:GatB/YqeY domain-containing protein [Akkermansia sp.]
MWCDMSTIYDQITEGMKTAMRAKDSIALSALRGLKTALQNAQVAKGNVQEQLPENEAQNVVRKQIKQREDSIRMYTEAGRPELVEKEEAEMKVLAAFLPAEMTESEILPLLEAVMAELGASTKKDMGRVMKEMQARTEGRAPGKLLSALVASRLA